MSTSFVRYFRTSARAFSKPNPASKDHHHVPISDDLFPRGFLATGLHSGVKKPKSSLSTPKDLSVIISTTSRTSSAACFTRNVFKAAPVQVSNDVLKHTAGRANKLVVNSGCANAVTGAKGLEDAWSMARTTDEAFSGVSTTLTIHGAEAERSSGTLVMSTGVIGQLLPISNVLDGIRDAGSVLSPSPSDKLDLPPTHHSGFADWEKTAQAFMTTDTFPKLRARSFTIPFPSSSSAGSKDGTLTVRMAGIDKGAGMIHPNMGPPHATLLGLIATDAPINPRSLQNALTYAVERSFNSISVDGDMSTNDTIVAFANGAAVLLAAHDSAGVGKGAILENVEEIDEEKHPEAFAVFRKELTDFAIDLAKLVVYDGEGATKFVTVTVKNAPSFEDAHHVASTVSTSALVKTALYGQDANWGRILCAVGYSPLTAATTASSSPHPPKPLEIDPTKVSVTFLPPTPSDGAPLPVLVNGEPESVDEARASELLALGEIVIEIDLGLKEGGESASYWTCDFSHEYVTINGSYRS